SNPEEDPVILWISGGPGCSGLSTLLLEVGTIIIDYANSKGGRTALKLNEYGWTKAANIIFIDQPAGAGYSYTKTLESSLTNDTTAARQTYDFLRKWFINHPKYLENPLYIFGESYGGILVPLVVNEICNGAEARDKPVLNMKGYGLGNPITDTFADVNEKYHMLTEWDSCQINYIRQSHFFCSHIISDEQTFCRSDLFKDCETIKELGNQKETLQLAKVNCHGNYVTIDPDNDLCLDALKKINQCLDRIAKAQISEPWCPESLATKKQDVWSSYMSSFEENSINTLQSVVAHRKKEWCREDNVRLLHTWANDKFVQKALNVREGPIIPWTRCNISLSRNIPGPNGIIPYIKDVASTVSYHQKFTHKRLRVLIFSGDHDMLAPHISTKMDRVPQSTD
ncbi:UNVERIFIED_CONTAM: Serine carboxypeptidase-like 18, partial [Sesamum latifolium]